MSKDYFEATEENLYHYYIELNTRLKDMSNIFGLSINQIRAKLARFGIKKTQKQASENMVATHLERDPDHFRKNAQRLKNSRTSETHARAGTTRTRNAKKKLLEKGLNYDAVFDLYIVQNKSLVYCAEHFSLTKSSFRKALEAYEIVKDPKAAEKARKASLAKLYSDPDSVEEIVKKTQATIKERYSKNWYYHNSSKEELEVFDYVSELLGKDIEIISGDYSVISKPGSGGAMQLDIYIPSLSLAIEYNGVYWHDKKAYLKDLKNNTVFSREALKDRLCNDKGVKLLHVWSDEWLTDPDIVKESIAKLLESSLSEVNA